MSLTWSSSEPDLLVYHVAALRFLGYLPQLLLPQSPSGLSEEICIKCSNSAYSKPAAKVSSHQDGLLAAQQGGDNWLGLDLPAV